MFFLAHLSTARSRGAFRVVRCTSCVVNNFFKHLLLPNRLANLDQAWQECSLRGPLQKLFTEFDSIKNSGCHGNEIEFLAHLSTTCSGGAIVTGHRPASGRPSFRPLTISLKIFSSKTRRPILIKLGRNVPWVKLYKNC